MLHVQLHSKFCGGNCKKKKKKTSGKKIQEYQFAYSQSSKTAWFTLQVPREPRSTQGPVSKLKKTSHVKNAPPIEMKALSCCKQNGFIFVLQSSFLLGQKSTLWEYKIVHTIQFLCWVLACRSKDANFSRSSGSNPCATYPIQNVP